MAELLDGVTLERVGNAAEFQLISLRQLGMATKMAIESLGLIEHKNVTIDFAQTRLVDHSVIDKLHGLQQVFEQVALTLTLIGLDNHRSMANHDHAARKRAKDLGV